MVLNKKTKTILAVTGSRSEYGILNPVLKAIDKHPNLKLILAVTGLHLLPKYGSTINEIKKDWPRHIRIPMYQRSNNTQASNSHSLARAITGFAETFKHHRPDFIVVIGDRLEPLAAVIAASIMSIPIAHIHGGDTSDCGQIDDSIRHSISKFAQIHFAASEGSAKRLIRMGEDPKRIYTVGSPAIDSMVSLPLKGKKELFQELGLNQNKPMILCLQHSIIHEQKTSGQYMEKTIKSLLALKTQTVVLYPNNDPGSSDIIKVIEKYRNNPLLRIIKNLDHQRFLSLLKYTSVLVGNSSSAIIEAPSFHIPAVSIGDRQLGREHSTNILFTNYSAPDITRATYKALNDKNFKNKVRACKSIYGNGRSGIKIAQILARIKVDTEFLRKKITY